MKKSLTTIFVVLFAALLAGCMAMEAAYMPSPGGEKIAGKDIRIEDITDFYYTEENINYNACYQRYRFYLEDGKHMFFHETRERKDDYGPCTEDDTTLIGTVELTDDQWSQFTDLVSGGTVKAREDSADSGDTGPWLYLYWTDDKGKYQQFSFDSHGTEVKFEEFCLSLVPDELKKEESTPGDEIDGIGQYIPDSEVEAIGVMMDVINVTPAGLTVRFRQYDDKGLDELTYGEGYTLERLNGDAWEAVPMIIDNGVFNDLGYIIPAGGESEIDTDWEWLYGKLSPGTYKITKEVWAKPQGGDSLSSYTLSAQFMLAGSGGILKTYEITDPDLSEQYIKDDKLVTMVRYYEMADGTWKTDDHSYKYKLEITGRMGGGAVKDSTFVYLSNIEDISFERAYMAAGLSSNMDDYFDPEDAVLVAMK